MKPKSQLIAVAALLILLSSCNKFGIPDEGGGGINSKFKVNSIFPLEGEPGSRITIKGIGFSKDSLDNKILFNGKVARLIKSSDTTIVAEVPETGTANAIVNVLISKVSCPAFYLFHYLDIYVTGSFNNGIRSYARFWKNGISQPVFLDSSFTTATRLSRDGNDIYFGTNKGYFKNGTYVPIDPLNIINSVVSHSGHVYAATTSGYYNNGVFNNLESITGTLGTLVLTDIDFQGDSLYLCGHKIYGNGSILIKNNHLISLSQNFQHSGANAVKVYGSDVYVGGYQSPGAQAMIWKNSIGIKITDLFPATIAISNQVQDIYINGSNEYLALDFWKLSPPDRSTLYFKNRIPVYSPEPNSVGAFSSMSITGQGDNIYVAGVRNGQAAYFRNGNFVTLSPYSSTNRSIANSILIVPR